MVMQKQGVMEQVAVDRRQGRPVDEVLNSLGVAWSSYCRWKNGEVKKVERSPSSYEITAEQRQQIDAFKDEHPLYRHRPIQWVLQQRECIYRRR